MDECVRNDLANGLKRKRVLLHPPSVVRHDFCCPEDSGDPVESLVEYVRDRPGEVLAIARPCSFGEETLIGHCGAEEQMGEELLRV